MSITQDLLTALKAVPHRKMPDGSPCYCAAVCIERGLMITGHGRRCLAARAAIAAADEPTDRDRMACIVQARRQYQSSMVQIDDDAGLSETDDGTWVQAWLWISDEDAITSDPQERKQL